MDIYDILGRQEHPVYGKPRGLITADDVASQFRTEIMGKTFLITGCGLASLGQHLAWTIACYEPKLLILCGRSDVKLRLLASNLRHRNPGLNVRHEVFDLADLSQVREAAERINAVETVDVIICNAGIMMHPLRKTADGIESQFGINSTSHFVLVNMMLPKMMANGGGRVVTTTSGAYNFTGIRWEDPNYEVCLWCRSMFRAGAALTHSGAGEPRPVPPRVGLCCEQNSRHTVRRSSCPQVRLKGYYCYQRRYWRQRHGY